MGTSSSDPEDNGTLSVHRSFIVRIYADRDLAHGQASGQVEHVVSGQGSAFHSVDELLGFMCRVLRSHEDAETGSDTRACGTPLRTGEQ